MTQAMIYKLKLQNQVDGLTTKSWTFRPPTVVGRDPSSGICIEHDSISRKHCQLSQNSDGALVVKDLDSKNGTYIDDERIHSKTLMPGESIQIGALRLEVVFSTEDELPAMPPPRPKGSVTETQPMKRIDALPPPPVKSWWRRLIE